MEIDGCRRCFLFISVPTRFKDSLPKEVEQMEYWGIYFAYAWLATIMWAFIDAVQAIRNGPEPQPQRCPRSHATTTNEQGRRCAQGVE